MENSVYSTQSVQKVTINFNDRRETVRTIVKIAVVTGASRGLGREIQKQLLRLGFEVITMSRTKPDDLSSHHLFLDLLDAENMETINGKVVALAPDGIDLLVNCAGFGISGPFEETSLQDVRRQFDVNVFGAWELTRKLLPLLERKKGRILFVGSVAGTVPIPFQSFYSVTKSALKHMSLCLDIELKPLGMRSMCVELGDIRTTFTDHRQKIDCSEKYAARCNRSVAMMEKDERKGDSPENVAPEILKTALSKNPPPVWTHGKSYQLLSSLYRMMPVRLSNAIIGRMYG